MRRNALLSCVSAGAVLALGSQAFGIVSGGDHILTDGTLTVRIRPENGAIALFSFGGSDYFNPGAPEANWGMQNGTDTSTFSNNNTFGGFGVPAAVAPVGSTVEVTGTFDSVFGFTRTYSLVSGFPVLKVDTTITNLDGVNPQTISYYDSVDPDQGIDQGNGYSTINDIFSVLTTAGPVLIGSAVETGGLTILLASLDARSVSGFEASGLAIGSGAALNSFLTAPLDPNGGFADVGLNMGFRDTLAAGASTNYVFYYVPATNRDEAALNFLGASDSDPNPNRGIPEPMTGGLALLGLAALASTSLRRRRA